jgi:hypothetical protein
MNAHYFFCVFFNTAFSFLAGLVVVWGAVRFFRIGPGRVKLFLFALPFVKILWDLFYIRVPENSVIFAGFDPLTAPAHGNMVSIGAGFSQFGPTLNLAMFEVKTPDGKHYTLGVADYLFALISKYMGHSAPYLILSGALAVSLVLFFRRIFVANRFERERRSYRLKDRALDRLNCGGRVVDLYVSAHFEGSPFTGGILKPYICFPESAYSSLSVEQRQAVIHQLRRIKLQKTQRRS